MKTILLFICVFFIHHVPLKAEELHSPKKVLIFDFGGVIAKTDKQIIANHLRQFLPVDEETFLEIQKNFYLSLRKGISEREFLTPYAKKYHIELPKNFEKQFEETWALALHEIQGTRALIKFYKDKGYQIALLSNTTPSRAKFLRSSGWYEGFSPVLLSCEIGINKPNLKAYHILLERIPTSAENCIFIDDKLENVKAARELGIDAIQFINIEQLQKDLSKRSL